MSASLSSSDSGDKFRVAICGAGIAGLVLAITIGKYDPSIPIDIYEAHDSIETAGVGIVLRRHEVLMELGLFDEFKQIFSHNSMTLHGAIMRRSDIREGGYFWNQRTHLYATSAMHRQQMVAILEKNLPASCTVHLGKQLLVYTDPEQQDGSMTSPIELKFADGTRVTTDVLIGADGIRSAVRKAFFEAASVDQSDGNKIDLKQYIEATFTGMTIYRCLFPAETLRRESPENLTLREMASYHGKGRALVTYPVAEGTMINCAAVICDPSLIWTRYEGNWVSSATRDELVGLFDDFESDPRTVVKFFEQSSKWALHVVKPLPFCTRNRVALIGDACHATTPHFGAGAGQAIEDAFVLGRLIAHPLTSLSRIPDALHIYEEVRFPIARDVAKLSLSSGWMYSFMEPGLYDGGRKQDDVDSSGISAYERDGMESIKQEDVRRWDWLEGLSSALQQWEEAESKLTAFGN